MTKDDRLKVMGLIGDLGDLTFLDKEGEINKQAVKDFSKLAKKLYLESICVKVLKPKQRIVVYDVIADAVVEAVNGYFGIDLTEMGRCGINAKARKLTCLLLKAYTTLTASEMGTFIRRKPVDHSTVLHHIKTGTAKIVSDTRYKRDFEALINMVNERLSLAEEAA